MARIIPAFSQFLDDNGEPLVKGSLRFLQLMKLHLLRMVRHDQNVSSQLNRREYIAHCQKQW